MSSAENDKPTDVRLVPMTRGQRDRLSMHGWRRESDAWDAAPADPAEAAEAALVERYGSSFADGTGRNVALAMLAALGVPDTKSD